MNDETVRLLADLVQSDSTNPPGTEEHVAEHVEDYLKRHDVAVQRQSVRPGRFNLIASLAGAPITNRPSLLFCGHMDTVPIGNSEWGHDPFGAEVENGVLFGRGASDMKSGVAAMAVMMALLRKDRRAGSWPIKLLLTVGEEVDSVGAQHYGEQYGVDDIGGMVIGEPTNGQIAIGHKGAYWIEMRCFGRTAHGSMPSLGINAIDQIFEAANMLHRLRSGLETAADSVLGSPTIAITQIGGGVQTNVIPDQAFLRADMRFATAEQQQKILRDWKRALERYQQTHEEFRYEWHRLLERAPLLTPPTHPLIQKTQELRRVNADTWRTVSYYTDGSVIAAPTHIPTVIYGPGDDRAAHQPDESVSLASYFDSIEFYRELATSYALGEWQLTQDE